MNGFVKEESDPFYLKGLNDKAAAIQSIGSKVYEQFVAQAEDEQINFTAVDTVNSQLATIPDGNAPQGFFKNLDITLDNLGTNLDERHDALFKGITHALDMGNIAGAEAAAEHLLSKGKAVSGKYGSKLEKQIAIAKARQEAAEKEAMKVSDLEKAQTRRAFESTVGTEDFNMAAIDEATENDVITPDQNVSLYRRHEEALKKRGLELDRTAIIEEYKRDPRTLFNESDPKVRKAVYDSMDADYEALGEAIINNAISYESAQAPEDLREIEAQRGQILTAYKEYFERSQAAGHTPGNIKRLTDSAVLGTPQFQHTATVVEALESIEGVSPFVGVNTEKLAELKAYNELTERYSPEEAVEILKQRQETPLSELQANMRMDGFNDEFETTIDSLVGNQSQIEDVFLWFDKKTNIQPSAYLRETIRDDAAVFYGKGLSLKKSMKEAKKKFLDTHAPIGSAWVSTKNMPTSFPAVYDDWIKSIDPSLNPADYIIQPKRDVQGSFIMNKKDGTSVTNSQGELVVFSYHEVVKAMAENHVNPETEYTSEWFESNKEKMQMDKGFPARARLRREKLLKIEEELETNYGRDR
jgi:hypothetical protein